MAFNSHADITKPQDIFSKVTAMLVVTSDQASSRTAAQRNRDELESLCSTLGIRCTAWDFFNIRSFNSATYIGSGQVQRLAWIAQENQCNLVVFNNSISPRIQRNLEEILGIAVVDRQEIILQIFADRATTREARLQVELAQLQYSLPRLKRKWADLSQQRGGVKGAKGSGEKQLELDRRQAQTRIVRLKREIAEIGKSRDVQRRNRTSGKIANVAIVGYTNSGKSTLLNRISDSNVLSQDMLFATLDPTTRRVRLPNGNFALFTDTVGFVSDLPHELVEAFKSTLDEAVLADVLLIVLDASREDFISCWDTTRDVLAQLGAFEKPRLVLLNKMDKVTEESLFAINTFSMSGEHCMKVSVTQDSSMENVLNEIAGMLEEIGL
ncbi:MAG: GTPase HflX [Spirochaetales bacterium]|nr:GTPase HflX [Spirochaetales bacterium]MBQ3831020.1 GTPase HflX [Spirochaetales bacterium]MBQ6124272.1 GTPase HflX [Spirochaetales bacterium]MBQ7729969.1 GTPase HflX [Spirochaetales bacterium]MBQ9810053.1 GTPase HflX [Spirochaetales bacterium]